MAVDIVREWLTAVERDLKAIRNCLFGPDPTPAGAAYHCQQAAEKLVKAVLISTGIHPRKTHDIQGLVAELGEAHPMRPVLAPFMRFTPFAWAFRYPSLDPMAVEANEPSLDEVTEWLKEILSAVQAVEVHLGLTRPPSR
jgi:HEPN domain-containing protein